MWMCVCRGKSISAHSTAHHRQTSKSKSKSSAKNLQSLSASHFRTFSNILYSQNIFFPKHFSHFTQFLLLFPFSELQQTDLRRCHWSSPCRPVRRCTPLMPLRNRTENTSWHRRLSTSTTRAVDEASATIRPLPPISPPRTPPSPATRSSSSTGAVAIAANPHLSRPVDPLTSISTRSNLSSPPSDPKVPPLSHLQKSKHTHTYTFLYIPLFTLFILFI